MHAIRVLFLLSIITLAASCKKQEPAPAPAPEQQKKPDQVELSPEQKAEEAKAQAASVRRQLTVSRALLDEAARAELEVGGLFVDMGTADQHKYTRGGWHNSMGENGADGGVTVANITGGTTRLEGMARAGAKEVVVRARSKVAGQGLGVWVDGTAAGNAAVGSDWSLIRMPVANVASAGRREVLLRLKKSGSPRAEIDWVWLAETAGAEPPVVVPRSMNVNLGRPRRALPAPTARTYSFYMEVPDNASLVFDYGSDKGATFSVAAEVDGSPKKQLFGPKTATAWTEAQVDLKEFAQKTIRLELQTAGPAGIAGWGEPEIMVTTPKETAQRGAAAKNAIVILIDTQRADVFPLFNPKSKVHTPSFNALAKESVAFVNAYTNENWTKPSVATTLTGLYPSTHTTKEDASKIPDKVELLPERLKKEGFATAGFVANGYVSGKFGFEKGWDLFINYIRDNKQSEAEYVYRDAVDWIKKHKNQRFFTYIQTIDPHVVYRHNKEEVKRYFQGEYKGVLGTTVTPEEQIGLSDKKIKFTDNDLNWLKALYWGESTYHDQYMGQFIEELRAEGVLDNTVVIVTNDHGEELMEHGRAGHGHSLYDELVRAPILVRYPGIFPAGKVAKEVIESVDIAPTVTDVLGVKGLKDAEGISLVNIVTGKSNRQPTYAISEFLDGQRSIRVGRWKMIRTPGDRWHLFDVVADPGETVDYGNKGTATRPIARRIAEIHLGEGLATPDKSKRLDDAGSRQRFTAGCADIDPATRKQLEALGYFGGEATPCGGKEKAN